MEQRGDDRCQQSGEQKERRRKERIAGVFEGCFGFGAAGGEPQHAQGERAYRRKPRHENHPTDKACLPRELQINVVRVCRKRRNRILRVGDFERTETRAEQSVALCHSCRPDPGVLTKLGRVALRPPPSVRDLQLRPVLPCVRFPVKRESVGAADSTTATAKIASPAPMGLEATLEFAGVEVHGEPREERDDEHSRPRP